MIDAIVPAHNEQATVRAVARALLDAGCFGRVIVVDDGSTDATAAEAARAGAEVLRLAPNRGKAGAMLAGVAISTAPALAFMDADAVGLRPEHAHQLVNHFARGFDMVCGIQDHGFWSPIAALLGPLLTGQRIVHRWVLEALPPTCTGYSVEAAMNFIVDAARGSTCIVTLKGVTFRDKSAKVGVIEGGRRNARMFAEIRAAKAALQQTRGAACQVERRS